MSRFTIIPLFLLLLAKGCQTEGPATRPPLEDEGELYVYLEPLALQLPKFKLSLVGVSAVGEGSEVPLALSLPVLEASQLRRQRLLVSGPLPEGSYSGLSLKVGETVQESESGEDHSTTATSLSVEYTFSIRKKRAVVLWLTLKGLKKNGGGTVAPLDIGVQMPPNPPIALLGCALDAGSDDMLLFDKRAGKVFGAIAVGRAPRAMALDQRSRKAYVSIPGGNSRIEVVDLVAGEVVNQIRLNPGDDPSELVLTQDGRMLLSANTGSNTVSFLDPVSSTEMTRINVGEGPRSLRLDPSGARIYVLNSISNTISVVDVFGHKIIATLSTETNPLRAEVSARGDKLYVIHEWSPYMLVFELPSLNILNRVFMGMGMKFIKLDSKTDLLYLARMGDTHVIECSPFSFIPTSFADASGMMTHMTIDGEENNLYVVMPESGRIGVVNLVTRSLRSEIDVGRDPCWVAMMGER